MLLDKIIKSQKLVNPEKAQKELSIAGVANWSIAINWSIAAIVLVDWVKRHGVLKSDSKIQFQSLIILHTLYHFGLDCLMLKADIDRSSQQITSFFGLTFIYSNPLPLQGRKALLFIIIIQ